MSEIINFAGKLFVLCSYSFWCVFILVRYGVNTISPHFDHIKFSYIWFHFIMFKVQLCMEAVAARS
jgi:hypothetical protein